MKRISTAILILCMLSMVLSACEFVAPAPPPTPTPTPLPPVPPQVVKHIPAQGEEQGLTESIVVAFDQPMDKEAVEAALQIEPAIPMDFNWPDDRTLNLALLEPLERGNSYEVSIGKGAKSTKGLAPVEPFSLHFEAVGYLEVTEVQPALDAKEIDPDANVVVVFNRPVVPLTSIAEQVDLPKPLTFTPPVKGDGRWLNTSIYTFEPEESFDPATTYEAEVTAGLEDTTGGVLDEDYVWTFTTKLPAVVKTYPEDNALYTGPSEPIRVTFDQPMDKASAREHFSLVAEETGEPVEGDFRWENDRTMVFVPAEPLALETSYLARVSKGARATGGEGGTKDDYLWRFTTVGLPRVASTDPADGEARADPYRGVELYFASPMDRETVEENLTILPEPAELYTYWSDSDTRLSLSFTPEPSKAYTVILGAEAADSYGQELGEPHTVRFTTRALDPLAHLNGIGNMGTYNAYAETKAYVTFRNVSRLDFSLYRLGREEFLYLNGRDSWQRWRDFEPEQASLIRRWSEEVSAPLNEARFLSTTIAGEGKAVTPGLYYLEVEGPGVDNPSRQMMVISPLNLILKAAEEEALIWATDLSSGQPVPDLEVSLYDEDSDLLATGRTGADGVFETDFAKRDPWQPIFAFAEEPFSAALDRWSEGITPWEFDIPSQFVSSPYRAYFYTDRAIYRPGQKVYFKGILRSDDDAHYSLPTGVESLPVTVRDEQGREIYHEELPLSDMGTLHGEFTLDEEASLGYYSIEARFGEQSFGAGFQVAEYRKPEFEVKIETDGEDYVQGDEIVASVAATYYFGGPVADAKVHWSVLSRDHFFRWEGKERYSFVDYEWEEHRYPGYGELIGEGSGETDEGGHFTFEVPAEIADKTTSQIFTIEATVTDINGQETSSRTEVLVHKGLFYIGLAPRSWVGTVGKEQQVDIITVGLQSQPVPEVELDITVFEHKWYSVQEKSEDGRFYWTSEVEDIPVLTTTVTTDEEGKAVASFTPDKGGTYKVLAVGEDERGNEVRSSTYLWVSSREFISWRRENNDRIELIADKETYTPGETAEILIPSPYQGKVKALLTVERGHIIEHKVMTLKSNSELIELPIRSEYAPNVYVSAVIVKGQDETNPLPSFKIGYTALSISTVEKELKVAITPDKEEHYGPRETVTYAIRTTDHWGKGVPAELSLNLVDLSVLALAEPLGPTLLEHFYGQRGIGVRTAAGLAISVDRLIQRLAAEAKGGGGGPAAGMVRRRFPETAYWNPGVRTDESGHAQVSVELPDTLTTWRLSAKAVTVDTKVGEADVDIVSTKDLLVRPTAPRFFVVGDEAELTAVVHNNTDELIEAVEVALSAEGLTVEGGAQRVEVPARGKMKASWKVAVENVDEAKLLFLAEGGDFSDAVEITLPIYHYSTPEVVATSGQLKEAGERLEAVYLPEELSPGRGELTVYLEHSLAAGMTSGLDYLEHYPYACIEQTVSRFLPNVFTYRALKKLGIEREELATKLPQQVGVALQRIYAEQHYDGGWGWWLADESDAYLTAYVLLGLNEAKRAGFAVNEEVLERAVEFLKGSFVKLRDVEHPYQANTQAFVLYILAECGEGDLGRTVALYERRDILESYSKAYLGMALALLTPEEGTRLDAIVNDLVSSASLSTTGAHWEEEERDYWTMNTDARSTAIVLEALTRLDPQSEILPQVVRWLMVARREGHWETTQETAWALIALTDYLVATRELEADYSYRVSLNDEELAEGAAMSENLDEQRKLLVEIDELLRGEANRLLIERLEPTGEGRLYYSAHLRYFLPAEEVRAESRGIVVARQYSPMEEPDRFIKKASVGNTIRVKLTIVAPQDLHYLVVEDPLPAGCEAIDMSLKTASVVGERPELVRLGEEEGWGWWCFSHTELRDEKAVLFATHLPKGTYEYTYLIRASIPGRFSVKPARAYLMYFPDVWGRSDGAEFTVR